MTWENSNILYFVFFAFYIVFSIILSTSRLACLLGVYMIDLGFDLRSVQTEDHEIDICCCSAMHEH